MSFSFKRNLERAMFIVVGIIICGLINLANIGINAQDNKGDQDELTDRDLIILSIALNKIRNDKISKNVEVIEYMLRTNLAIENRDVKAAKEYVERSTQSRMDALKLLSAEYDLMGKYEPLRQVDIIIYHLMQDAKNEFNKIKKENQ